MAFLMTFGACAATGLFILSDPSLPGLMAVYGIGSLTGLFTLWLLHGVRGPTPRLVACAPPECRRRPP